MRSLLLAVLLAMPNPDNAYLESMRAAAKQMGGTLMRVGDTPSMLGSGINNKYIAVIAQPDYDVGDLVVFKRRDGGLTIHPVTHKKPNKKKRPGYHPMGSDDTLTEMPQENLYFTKGTKNPVGDGWIPLEQVLGKTASILDPGKPASTTKAGEKALAMGR